MLYAGSVERKQIEDEWCVWACDVEGLKALVRAGLSDGLQPPLISPAQERLGLGGWGWFWRPPEAISVRAGRCGPPGVEDRQPVVMGF